VNDLEYMADVIHRHREKVLYPQAERRAALERELTILQREQPKPSYRRKLLESIGGWMISAGERLAALSMPRQVSRPG
jgi:hypothetical protein